MKKNLTILATVVLATGTVGLASAQTTQGNPPATTQTGATESASAQGASAQGARAQADGTYATGKAPLETQSKEGFWGHVNPFARKKWVHRQVDPLKDRVNELDELQAKNANDIRDVDSRATAGVNRAMGAANAADAHAADASGRADAANSMATAANGHVSSLNGTVSNLDQYSTVSSTSVKFAPGRTVLGPKAKSDLDDLAARLASEKGYIVEVQGYSRAGVPQSQAMADSVVRYLVTAHQVPIYRIYKTGLGKTTAADAKTESVDEKPLVNGVRVTLLHNSLATMGSSSSGSTSSSGTPTTSKASAGGTAGDQ